MKRRWISFAGFLTVILLVTGCGLRQKNEQKTTAMAIPFENGEILFVDQDNGMPFTATLPEGKIYDAQGKKIDASELQAGNIVEMTGNGAMAMSYPGQYPGITSVRVKETGSPEDVRQYDEIVNQLTGRN